MADTRYGWLETDLARLQDYNEIPKRGQHGLGSTTECDVRLAVHEGLSSWSGYCQSEVIERLCRGKSHSLGRRLMCWASCGVRESVEEKPLSGLVQINTEDFRFPKSGVYTCGGPHSLGIFFEILYAPSVPTESLDIMAIDQAELGEDPEDWRTPFAKYLKNGWHPEDEAEASAYSLEPQDTSWFQGSCIAPGCSNPCFAASPLPKARKWRKKYTRGYANIVCRFGVPKEFITDNGKQFDSDQFREMCEGLNLEIRPTKFSPFMLLYGDEAMTPTELGANSSRVMFSGGKDGREVSLKLLEEVRVEALEHMREYAKSTSVTYNRKVRATELLPGHLVLWKKANPVAVGKLESKWEGLYLIKHRSRMGSFCLATLEGEEFDHSWNAASLKRFYV
uniref:Retrotransposon protein, putative, unclassified n=1 Tax=Oryza sativa subsp. japonica TaxID=39947 RepID=Q2QUW2_ORYSJ|nr:retrotransposon protein, putative, unclassified [Oryza sativa Japonica Group]